VGQRHHHTTWPHAVQVTRDEQVPEPTARIRFEDAVLPHLNAAYNLARWLTRHDQDAEDVVQEAYMRAWKFFGSFHGGESRPWLLTIVRRTCYTWLQHNRAYEGVTQFDDERHSVASAEANPETPLLHQVDAQELRHALEALPLEFREVIILGRNEMDPPLCGSTAMSHNEFKKIREPIEPQEVSPMKQEMTVLGIDLAKHVFHAVGMDNTGKIVFRKRLSRHDLMPFIAKLPMVLIGLEACGGAHYWARRFRASGHEVKLMAPQFVKPYVNSNKNDSRDAEAIAEAVTRPTMRFVPAKDVDQQDIQALHRVRERLIGERTALVNAVHGLLHE